jgi:rubrerythrin
LESITVNEIHLDANGFKMTIELRVNDPELYRQRAQASWSFNIANEVEKIHAQLYTKAAEALKDNRDMPHVDYYVCQVCGNTVENVPPDKCPICNAPAKSFNKID